MNRYMIEEIRIPLSKKKLIRMAIYSLLMIALGLQLLVLRIPSLRLIGIASILFFGNKLINAVKMLFDKRPGLILANEGVTDNGGAMAVGLIPWEEITGFQVIGAGRVQFLSIFVLNPEQIIDRHKNPFKKFWARLNFTFYKTPVHIPAAVLDCDFRELTAIFAQYLRRKEASS